MEKGMNDYEKLPGDVILVSIGKKSGVINAIWPEDTRLHGIAGKKCIGKKITSFLTPDSKKTFKAIILHRDNFKKRTFQLEFLTKKCPVEIYSCSLWHNGRAPLTLVIRPLPANHIITSEREIANKEKYRIIETLPMAISVSDEDGNTFYTNPAFTQLFGFTSQNIPALDIWLQAAKGQAASVSVKEMFTADASGIYGIPGMEAANKDFMRQERQVPCLSGSIKDVEIFSHLCNGSLYLIFNDLTGRKKAEHLKTAAEEKFRRMIEKIPMPISAYEMKAPKRFHFINPKFTEWLGYTIEDIPDIAHWRKLAFKDDDYYKQKEQEWYTQLEKVKSGEISESPPIEFTVYCKDGTVKDLEISFTVDDNLFYTTYNDITFRKKAEKALQENEKKFRNISEQLPIPIVVFGEKGETRFLNHAFTDTFGYTREDIPTSTEWINAAYPDQAMRDQINAKWERDYLKNALRTQEIRVSQYEVTCKNGKQKIVEFYISIGNRNIYVVFNDISGKVKAERELKQSHRQLRELSSHLENIREEERKHISREIHDELGQQLTLLKLDLLQIGKKLHPGELELIDKMKQCDELLAGIMRSVRKIATQLRPSILDNLGLVSALEWQSREFERNFGIRCVFESLLTDPMFSEKQSNALFRIYQEALTNIARHSGATRVDAVLSEENNNIILEVRDNGKGFVQHLLSGKKTLGLEGMQERTLMIDGQFNMNSVPGKGTYIHISIPIITDVEIN
jgi:PAS domain S-box-containing protein